MEMIKNALSPAQLELRKLHDKTGGAQAPVMEVITPHHEGTRKQRRAAEALARKQRKGHKQLTPA